MSKMTFDNTKPYRVIEIKTGNHIVYKIQQPKRYFLIGFSKKYFDVKQRVYRDLYSTVYFENKSEVDEFINKKQKLVCTIAYDSLKDK